MLNSKYKAHNIPLFCITDNLFSTKRETSPQSYDKSEAQKAYHRTWQEFIGNYHQSLVTWTRLNLNTAGLIISFFNISF